MYHCVTIMLSMHYLTYHIVSPTSIKAPQSYVPLNPQSFTQFLAHTRCSINICWVQWAVSALLSDHILFTFVSFPYVLLCAFDSNSPIPPIHLQSTALGLPHAEDLSAWACTPLLSSPQPRADWCGGLRAQLPCPWVLSSTSASKTSDWIWALRFTQI